MTKKMDALVIFLVLVVVVFATVSLTLSPPPLPEDSSPAAFSAERAIAHIQVISASPRPTGSSGYRAAQKYVLSVLGDLGLDTEIQSVGGIQNTIGWIRGHTTADAVLLTAHLDTVAESPGATDDGSGVAVLLETARALMVDAPFRNTIMFLFTDCEEEGFYGARVFIANHPQVDDVKVIIGFDAGGIDGPGVLAATSDDNGWLIRQLVQADLYLVGSSAINALADSRTDFGRAFKGAGFSGYAFDLYWNKAIIHSPEDDVRNLNLSSIQHQGYHALSLASHFGNLTQLDDPRDPDAVYFSILRLFSVTYSSTWAVPFATVVFGVFCGILGLGIKQRILTWAGIGNGIFVFLVGLLIAPLPNVLLGTVLSRVVSQVTIPPLEQRIHVSLIVMITMALIVFWYSLSRRIRKTELLDLTIGALTPMVVGMVVTSIAFPALSFAFAWPLLFSLMACANWFYWYSMQRKSILIIVGLLFAGIATLVILGPSIFLGLFDQMSLALLFLGVLFGFLVPQIHIILGFPIGSREGQETRPV
jgi:hypothetical protein